MKQVRRTRRRRRRIKRWRRRKREKDDAEVEAEKKDEEKVEEEEKGGRRVWKSKTVISPLFVTLCSNKKLSPGVCTPKNSSRICQKGGANNRLVWALRFQTPGRNRALCDITEG